MGDVVVIGVLGFILPRPWNWLVVSVGMVLLGAGLWIGTHILRTAHRLDELHLTLRFGKFRAVIPREAIVGARALEGSLPRGVPVPTRPPLYRPEDDTLYLVAERRGLVHLSLDRPVEARTGRQGVFQFTGIVLSLDEPARFLAALAGTPAGAVAVARADGDRAGITPAGTDMGVRGAAAPACQASSVSATPDALRLEGLTRRFGDFTAVREISLSVAPGEILAFLGSNGAGKTTTVKMMVGLLRPTAGRVLAGGRDLWAEGPEARRVLGYVPDVPILYEGLTAQEFLWMVGGLYGLSSAEARARARELLALLRMERWADHLIRNFSLGMKRKMAIAAALVHRPRVLVLDEVTNGLDPRATREVKDLILGAARGGTTIFLTTHLLDVAGELADRIAVIHRGELRGLGGLDDLRRLVGRPEANLEEVFLALTEDPPLRGTGVSA